MRGNKVFNIDIYGLKIGGHDYQFEYDDGLFGRVENSIISKGKGACEILLEKSETMITLKFHIKGTVQLICDRSSEAFDYGIDLSEQLILKYGEEFDKVNEEVWVIPSNFQTINVEEIIYEYIGVAIPMKKLHPKFGEDDSEGVELVYSSADESSDDESEETTNDPRWDILKKLKNSEN